MCFLSLCLSVWYPVITGPIIMPVFSYFLHSWRSGIRASTNPRKTALLRDRWLSEIILILTGRYISVWSGIFLLAFNRELRRPLKLTRPFGGSYPMFVLAVPLRINHHCSTVSCGLWVLHQSTRVWPLCSFRKVRFSTRGFCSGQSVLIPWKVLGSIPSPRKKKEKGESKCYP